MKDVRGNVFACAFSRIVEEALGIGDAFILRLNQFLEDERPQFSINAAG